MLSVPGITPDLLGDTCSKLIEARAFPASYDVEATAPTYTLVNGADLSSMETERCLDAMLLMELVDLVARTETRSVWRLTEQALQYLRSVVTLKLPKPIFVCSRTDEDWEQYTLFEMWLTLDADGWHIQGLAARQKRSTVPAFAGGEAPKTLYLESSVRVLPRWRMVAHLLAGRGQLQTPLAAFLLESAYKDLVFPERALRRANMERVRDLQAFGGTEAQSEGERNDGENAGSDSDEGQASQAEDEEGEAAEVEAQQLEGTDLVPPPSSTSSSSSSSSTSSSKSSSSDSSSSGDEAAASGTQRNPEVFAWGNGSFDFTWKAAKGKNHAAWQVRCRLHAVSGLECRRTRSLETTSADPTSPDSQKIIRRLKMWCLAAHPELQQIGGGNNVEAAESHKHLPRRFAYDLADNMFGDEELERLLSTLPGLPSTEADPEQIEDDSLDADEAGGQYQLVVVVGRQHLFA